MNKLRGINKQYVGIALLVLGLIGNIYIDIAGSLSHPVYNRTAAYIMGFKEHYIIGVLMVVCLITGYILVYWKKGKRR
jgi:hypothetical protein